MCDNRMTCLYDEHLISLIQQGDMDAMAEIYQRYHPMVRDKCLSFTKNIEQAKDLAHDVMIKVMDKINSFKGESKFSTWLYAITLNYCIDHVKKSRFNISLDADQMSFEYIAEDKEEGIFLELKERVAKKALNAVSEKDQQMLIMKYQLNKSIKELQDIYNISASAVKMRLLRARGKATDQYSYMMLNTAA